MDGVECESFWLLGPGFANVLVGSVPVGCEALERLEALGKVVGTQEELQVLSQPIMAVIEVAPRGDFLDTVASLTVRFIRSTWPLVQGWFGLVSRWSMSALAQVYSKACARNTSPAAMAALISAAAERVFPGVVIG